ncbi:YqaJ viral recombinase family protein [Georgenia faecalis]|uniref:YqaJ viral recombinase family nuclease n=1 Tax=Georgenia faecalis TaxID=2483799 RepID=UPI000FDA7C29|nr:YqaJ viral recombinase family protein [Georgenia faecalis]
MSARTAGTAVYIGNHTAGTTDWHKARRGSLGGSEIAAVVGLAPSEWSSRFALWHYKAGLLPPDTSESFKQTLGKVLEDAVVQLHVARNGGHVQRTGMWRNVDRPWQVAAPDRFKVPAPRSKRPFSIVEAKTADSGNAFEWGPDGGGNDDVPPYYACQVLWYLDTFGFDEATLSVLIGAREFREYTLRYSAADAAWLRREAEAFLDSLTRGQAPPIDGADATYQAVRELHPDVDGTAIDLPYDVAQTFAEARHGMKTAETHWNHARALVTDHMGAARTGWCNGVQIALRKSKGTTGTPWVEAARGLPDQIPTEHPDIEGSAA